MKPLVIVGAGGHGREAHDIAVAVNEVNPSFELVGFLDDALSPGDPAAPHTATILGGIDWLESHAVAFVPAVGSPELRRLIVQRFPHHEVADLIHPTATIGSHVSHGPGLIMAAGSRVTHAVTLGQHVHINVNSTISHDCRVGDFVTITPGVHLSGSVTLHDEVWMGIGSSAIQGVTVGARSVVGAGAAIIHDVPPDTTTVGVPGRPAHHREDTE
ncbi:acetyltransferase [Ornithinimicrobium cavernae]|uniref:acetyltransferase n=1 Tax=Ornithinimicrobium cavernae TaxID=2666047 RepID=UPI00137A6D6E|nr:acetyltransferase [Ornithinimicrobium cavernae]